MLPKGQYILGASFTHELSQYTPNLWGGGLPPLGCVAAPKQVAELFLKDRSHPFGTPAQPSRSKLPSHR
ncbi:hypothetical protein PS914_04188 [Pseudomonas fluorescens]|nr:hypothetical protein PS914_04188 [Pseudomonas fluorescens]